MAMYTASIAQLEERPLSEQEVADLNPAVAPYQKCNKTKLCPGPASLLFDRSKQWKRSS